MEFFSPNAMLTAERNWSQEGNCKKSSAEFTRERDHGRSQCAEAQCWVEVAVQNTRFAFACIFHAGGGNAQLMRLSSGVA